MSSTVEPPVAALPAAVGRVIGGLAEMAGVPLWTAAETDVLAGLDALMEAEARLAGVRSRLIGEVESRGLPTGMACANTRALLRLRYRLTPHAAKELDDLAYAGGVFPAVGQGMVDGVVHPAQAQAIIAGLDKLPAGTSTEDRTRAQELLIDQASALDASELRRAPVRIVENLTVVSEDDEPPEGTVPDPHEKRSITFHWRNGGLAGQFYIPETDAADVAAFFAARAQPDSEHHGDPDHPAGYDTRRTDQRQYDAIREALRHASGCRHDPGPRIPHVVVTMTYDWLLANLTGTGGGTAGAADGATGGATGMPMPPAGSAQAGAAVPDSPGRLAGLPRLLDLDRPISPAEAPPPGV